MLFLGVIDILQKYRFFKKFEHTWKSILYKAVCLTNSYCMNREVFKFTKLIFSIFFQFGVKYLLALFH